MGAINDILELNTKSHSLVVDGKTLTLIMAERKSAFSNISHQCATVLCCRMSPLQKAQIVSMVKGERHASSLEIIQINSTFDLG